MNKKEFVFQYNNNVHRFTASTTPGGYRGTNYYPPERKPNTIRIVADGSSWTFGWNVDDAYSWPAQLEKILKERNLFSQEVEIINAGSPTVGAAPRDMYNFSVFTSPIWSYS